MSWHEMVTMFVSDWSQEATHDGHRKSWCFPVGPRSQELCLFGAPFENLTDELLWETRLAVFEYRKKNKFVPTAEVIRAKLSHFDEKARLRGDFQGTVKDLREFIAVWCEPDSITDDCFIAVYAHDNHYLIVDIVEEDGQPKLIGHPLTEQTEQVEAVVPAPETACHSHKQLFDYLDLHDDQTTVQYDFGDCPVATTVGSLRKSLQPRALRDEPAHLIDQCDVAYGVSHIVTKNRALILHLDKHCRLPDLPNSVPHTDHDIGWTSPPQPYLNSFSTN